MTAPSNPVPPLPPRIRLGTAAPPSRRMLAPSRQRRVFSKGQMARRRFAMRWIKRLLPVAALALLSSIVLWPEIKGTEEQGRVVIRRMASGPEAVRVVEPRYQGVDEQNRPYNLTAHVARQQGNDNIVDLEAPRADMLLENGGSWVLLESREGRFDRGRNHLDLAGDVTLWHDNGTMLVTGTAAIELRAGSAEGDSPVAAQGPFGTLTAQGFRLRDRGQVVIFTGQSRLILEGGT